jgi:hypothetical protein
VREAKRITRPGGRVMVLGAGPPTGLAALLSGGSSARSFDSTPLLAAADFRSVRTLAERDGLVFVEAIKPRI